MDIELEKTNFREASFSAYLNSAEEKFVLKLVESMQSSPPSSPSSKGKVEPKGSGKKEPEDGEIEVFSAEKYFNVKVDDNRPNFVDDYARKCGNEKNYMTNFSPRKPKGKSGTPSLSSEASWSSQATFLKRILRNSSTGRTKKGDHSGNFTSFSCHGPCLDRKSVNINRKVRPGHEPAPKKEVAKAGQSLARMDIKKNSQPRFGHLVKDEYGSPRSLRSSKMREYPPSLAKQHSGRENSKGKTHFARKMTQEEPRQSLEVFGSNSVKGDIVALNLERKPSMLSWDAIPKAKHLPATTASNKTGMSSAYEDAESDASSDLFEIENVSGNTAKPIFTRQESEGISRCMTPTTLYEPSEASIEWSVVTASAADFSFASDYDEKKVLENELSSYLSITTPRMAKPKSNIVKEVQKKSSSGILGCNSHKAVGVIDSTCKSNEKAKSDQYRHIRPEPPMLPKKVPAEIKSPRLRFPQVTTVSTT